MSTDIPTAAELQALATARATPAVSIFVETTPETAKIEAARISLGNLVKEAVAQLQAADTPKRSIWPIEEQLADLLDDDAFWAHQGHALALYITPDNLRSFRLPNRVAGMVQVSDRFHLKPLFGAISGPQHAFVLALEENAVRLIEVTAGLPAEELRIDAMPKDAASAVGTASVNSRSYSGRKGGAEGQKVLLRAYCRQIDAALRPVIAGRSEPLILAAAEPLLSIYRSVNSYDRLAAEAISGSPAQSAPADLAASAEPVLAALHAGEVAGLAALYATRENEGRATTQIARAARGATYGAVDTLIVDAAAVVAGTVDEAGEITFAEQAGAQSYGVIDEIAARVMASGGRVVALERDQLPGAGDLAAILRYAV